VNPRHGSESADVNGGKDLQPNSGSGDFVADKVMAILVFIGAACGFCGGLLLFGIGGFAGAAGASGAASGGGAEAAAVAGFGAMGMLFGVGYIALAIAAIVGAIGMLKSTRKGLNLVMIVMGILAVLSIAGIVLFKSGAQGMVGTAIDLGLAGYCWARLNGKLGPAVTE